VECSQATLEDYGGNWIIVYVLIRKLKEDGHHYEADPQDTL